MPVRKNKKQSLQIIKSRSTQFAARTVPTTRTLPTTRTSPSVMKESYSLLLGFAGIFLLIALINCFNQESKNAMGVAGESIANGLLNAFGFPSFFLPLLAFGSAYSLWTYKAQDHSSNPVTSGRLFLLGLGFLSFAISCSSMAAVIAGNQAGGRIGTDISLILTRYFSSAGALLLSFAGALISFVTTTRISSSIFIKGAAKSFKFLSLGVGDGMTFMQAFAAFFFNTFKKLFSFEPEINFEPTEDNEHSEDWSIDGRSSCSKKVDKVKKRAPLLTTEVGKANIKTANIETVINTENPLISRRTYDEYLLQTKKLKTPITKSEPIDKRQSQNFILPPLALLVRGDSSTSTSPKDDELLQNSKRLEVALENFKITGKIVEVHPGPIVTLYQFEPGAGVKVQRIISLADDLALSLKVGSVRVYAPVPGKGTVGIEVPNSQREIVRLRDVIDTEDYKVQDTPLLLALGKDTYGAPYVADLAKMPHLLIAGATGTGKSVCINSILLSLLYRNTPDQLRLIMIDPKMLELSVYEDIPHLNAPVVTNPKHARAVLWWAVEEMDKRYELMKQYGVRNIAMFNRLIEENNPKKNVKGSVVELEEKDVVASSSPDQGMDRSLDGEIGKVKKPDINEPLPRIVIVVDELADLMLTVGREIEELLMRLAQKARASGIHLILATQRPSVNVITGLIKANFPARISFKVAGRVDARTVMDTSGAEKLLGQGDMLFMSPTVGRVMRLHSPFVSDKEVNDVVDAIKSQGAPRYDQGIEKTIKKLEETERPEGTSGEDEYDEYYDQAVQLVVEKGQASTSMVQRAFRIGYNRAARILEVMEREGVVGPADGARPRQVLIADLI